MEKIVIKDHHIYRIVFKRHIDDVKVDKEFVLATSNLNAEWKVSDKYNISRNLITSSSLYKSKVF